MGRRSAYRIKVKKNQRHHFIQPVSRLQPKWHRRTILQHSCQYVLRRHRTSLNSAEASPSGRMTMKSRSVSNKNLSIPLSTSMEQRGLQLHPHARPSQNQIQPSFFPSCHHVRSGVPLVGPLCPCSSCFLPSLPPTPPHHPSCADQSPPSR